MADDRAKPRHKVRNEDTSEGFLLHKENIETLPRVKALKTTKDDVFIATYPRSGTTWIGELVSCLLHGGDLETTLKRPHMERVPFLEYQDHVGMSYCGVDLAEAMVGSPRFMKTHLPYKYIQKQVEDYHSKVIVVARNVRDVAVSMYHFYQHLPEMNHFKGTWDEFFTMFEEKHIVYGDWLDHLRSYWGKRHLENIHIIFYEDAADDLFSVAKGLVTFLGLKVPEEQVKALVGHFSFSEMRENSKKILLGEKAKEVPAGEVKVMEDLIQNFFREGGYGKWRKYFSQEQDDFVKDNYDKQLRDMGITFKF